MYNVKVEVYFFDLPLDYVNQNLCCEIANGIEESTKILKLNKGGYVKLGKTKVVFGSAYECVVCQKIKEDNKGKDTTYGFICPDCLKLGYDYYFKDEVK